MRTVLIAHRDITFADQLAAELRQVTALDQQGQRYYLAVDSARAHPEVPLLLAWAPNQDLQ